MTSVEGRVIKARAYRDSHVVFLADVIFQLFFLSSRGSKVNPTIIEYLVSTVSFEGVPFRHPYRNITKC